MDTLKQIFIKYIGQILILVSVVGIIMFAYSAWRDANEERRFAELIGTKTKYEQLTKYTAKLESNYQSQTALHDKAKKQWGEVSRKKNERIKVLSDATYLIGRHVEKQHGPDYYFETKRGTRNYLINEIRLQGKGSPAIGYILIKNDGRTYKRNYKFEINVQSLQTVDEKTGRIKVYSKAFLVAKEVSPLKKRVKGYDDWYNRPYPLEITGGVAYIDPTTPNTRSKFFLWAPHINGGSSVSVGRGEVSIRPSIDLSIAGYGKSKNDLDWKILHLGLDIDTNMKRPGVHIVPFSYRFWPSLLTNSYIGPGVGWAEDGMNYQLNLNLTF